MTQSRLARQCLQKRLPQRTRGRWILTRNKVSRHNNFWLLKYINGISLWQSYQIYLELIRFDEVATLLYNCTLNKEGDVLHKHWYQILSKHEGVLTSGALYPAVSSSSLVKETASFPAKMDLPSGPLTLTIALYDLHECHDILRKIQYTYAGPWQTADTILPLAYTSSASLIFTGSTARSMTGPCPPT